MEVSGCINSTNSNLSNNTVSSSIQPANRRSNIATQNGNATIDPILSMVDSMQLSEYHDRSPNIGYIISSKMIVDDNHPPMFMYREKPTKDGDSGWRVYSGLESEAYTNEASNFDIYDLETILSKDDSISEILRYSGIGSVWERRPNTQWQQVFDFPLEGDFIAQQAIADNWSISINNLFLVTEEDANLKFTTNDKTLRLRQLIFEDKTKEQIINELSQYIDNREQETDVLERFDFQDGSIKRIGYIIKEYDSDRNFWYNLLCGFSIADNDVIETCFYFDDKNDKQWALTTWQSIG